MFNFFSSYFGRDTYFGFYVDCIIQAGAIMLYSLTVPLILSFFLGVCCYIETMVADMKATLRRAHWADDENLWSTYVNEIRFHCTVIE